MNQIAHFEERIQAGNWLIHWHTYDRTPTLSEAEMKTLDWYIKLRQQHLNVPIREGLPPGLQRVYEPLTRALDTLHTTHGHRIKSLHLILTRVHSQQTLYWAWGKDEWLQILDEAARSKEAHQRRADILPLIACAYLLTGFCAFPALPFPIMMTWMAKVIFGADKLKTAVDCLGAELARADYVSNPNGFQVLVSRLLLYSGSDTIEAITPEAASYVLNHLVINTYKSLGYRTSDALLRLGILSQPAAVKPPPKPVSPRRRRSQSPRPKTKRKEIVETAAPEWQQWCQRWYDTSPLPDATRRRRRGDLLRIGRWLRETHPQITSPEQWTRDVALAWMEDVRRWRVGDWTKQRPTQHSGQPLSATTLLNIIGVIRCFFMDCQQWNWLSKRFDPLHCFQPPRSLKGKVKPKPERRVIDAAVWARLVWAGLHLDAENVALFHPKMGFPYEMVQAIVIAWLFCGLRPNELYRLRLGCIRWPQKSETTQFANPICYLEIPPNKNHAAYTKPVDALVGEAITSWERMRPSCPPLLDEYTGNQVNYLFCHQGQKLSARYFAENLIPMLCAKANIPDEDSKGRITCVRARATIASQLANSENGMSALALSSWLGHKTIKSTLHYIKDDALTITKAYTDAGYFGRNVRVIEVLIDREAIMAGDTLQGAPWKYYDLGHGYCTYDFFDQCPHRMACVKCDFYRPKATFAAQLREAQSNLIQMSQKIPLTEAEQAAVADGLTAISRLYGQLANTAAPDGHIPYRAQSNVGIVSLDDIAIYPVEEKPQ